MQRRTSGRADCRTLGTEHTFRGQTRFAKRREAKVLVLLAILLPVLCGFVGLVLDSSLLMSGYRNLQQVSDAAATTAAMAISNGSTVADATAQAMTCVNSWNGLPDANVIVNIPPSTGPHAGSSNYAEVLLSRNQTTDFVQIFGGSTQQVVNVRSVAGAEPATAGAAVVVLDPNPPGVTVELSPYVSLSVSLPALQLGGLEVLGLGQLSVNGAVLDNNQWGGTDQNGNPAGSSARTALWRLLHAVDFTDEFVGPQHSRCRRRRQCKELLKLRLRASQPAPLQRDCRPRSLCDPSCADRERR